MKSTSLRTRLVLLVLAALLPVFALVVFTSLRTQDNNLERASSNLMVLARVTALGEDRAAEGARQLLVAIANSPAIKRLDHSFCLDYLRRIRARNPGYASIGILGMNGDLLCQSDGPGVPINAGDRDYFKRAILGNGFVIGEYIVGRATGRTSISFAVPIHDEKERVIGVAFAAVDLEKAAPSAAFAIPAFVQLVVTDRNGTVLAGNALGTYPIGSMYRDPAFEAARKSIPPATVEARDSEGNRRLYAIVTAGGSAPPGFYVITSIARHVILAPARVALAVDLAILLVVSILGIIAARWIGHRTIVAPTRSLLAKVSRLAGGYVPAGSPGQRDELADLDRSFDWLDKVLAKQMDERDQAEQTLRTNQALLDMASRLSHLGAWQYEVATGKVTWSRQLLAIHDLPPGYVPTLESGLDFHTPSSRERMHGLIAECLARGTPFDTEFQIVTETGREIECRGMGEAVRDAQGNIAGVQGALQDVTVQLQAERRERALRDRLSTTLESINDGFVTLDREWRFTFLNRQAEVILERSSEELIGRDIWEMFPEARGGPFHRQYEKAASENRAITFEEYYRPLGICLDVSVYPSAEGLAVYFRDVSARHTAQSQLHLLESAVARQNDIVMITDAEPIDEPGPRIVYVNAAFERQTGYSAAEVIGKSPRFLQGPNTDRAELDRIRACMEKWQPVRSEIINYDRAGQEFWLEVDIVPIADDKGWYTNWVAVERDITERKRVEAEILSLNADLEERVRSRTAELVAVNKELESFSYSVSHDLRGPLRAIEGFSSAVITDYGPLLPQEGRNFLGRIQGGALRMGYLIDDLLAFSRMSRQELKLQVCITESLVREVLETMETAYPGRQSQVVVGSLPDVYGDVSLLRQVWTNLLSNAFKYSAGKAAPRITAGSTQSQGETIFFVRDNGAGFNMAYAGKLFGVFQRLHGEREFEGTGVGLAIVKSVVERHGGRVWAEAAEGEGATFFFTLGKVADR